LVHTIVSGAYSNNKGGLTLEKNVGILKLMQVKRNRRKSPFNSLGTKKFFVCFNPSVSYRGKVKGQEY